MEYLYYCDQEISFRLKEIGFNESCNAYFDSNGKFRLKNNIRNSDCNQDNCTSPLYHQVINWIVKNRDCPIQVWSLDNIELLLMQIRPFLTKDLFPCLNDAQCKEQCNACKFVENKLTP
jgi:hypothetical protein